MFNPHAEPIANVPPYKRVSINDIQPADPKIVPTPRTKDEMTEDLRIWALVKETAEGTCMPISSPSSTGSPTDCDDTVCTDGWEAG